MSDRKDLRTGDIVICTRTGILGWGARLLGWRYQHAGLLRVVRICEDDVAEASYILEAVLPWVRPRELQKRDWERMHIYRVVGATPEDGESAWQAGLFYLGQLYGLPKAVVLVWRRICWLIARRLRPAYLLAATAPVFCSELCTVSWREGPGKDPVPGMEAEDVAPQDLAESPATERVY